MTKLPEGKCGLLCDGFCSLGLGMAVHLELDKAGWGQHSFLTYSLVTRHIAFLSSPLAMRCHPGHHPNAARGTCSQRALVQAQPVSRRQCGATLLTKMPFLPLPLPGAFAPSA